MPLSMNEPLPVPGEVKALHKTLLDKGYQAYLVGGCVRDILLHREPKDWDITTNAKPEEIQALFSETFYENDFGTVGVVTESTNPRTKVIEMTPFREEGKYTNARHPDDIQWADTLDADLKRRDFTINAIAYDPSTNTLVDLHGGQRDLEKKLLVTVGDAKERFSEDALRMLRAIRLSAELDFALDGNTAAAIAECAPLLQKISAERVRDELIRVLESDRPMQALYVAQKLGILKYMLPELEEGIGIKQNQAHSFEVFEHSLRTLQHAADKKWPLDVRIAAMLHDVGKPESRRWSDEKNDWTFYGHDVIGARIAKNVLTRLKFPKEVIDIVTTLVRWHMFFSDPDKITLSAVRRVVARVGTDHIMDLLNLRVCDRIGTGRPKEHPFRLRKYMSMVDEAMRDPISVSMLKIDGKGIMALGEAPGPKIGAVLHALLEEVLDDPSRNTEEYLTKKAREFLALNEEDLFALGKQGKNRVENEEEEAVRLLREKHHVR